MENEICEVNSQMALVLRLTRMIGVAPVRLSPAPRGYRVTVSRRYMIYSSVLQIAITIFMVSVFVYDQYILTKTRQLSLFGTMSEAVKIVEQLFITNALMLATCGGVERMRRFIYYMNEIKQINLDVENSYINIRLKKSAVIIWSIHFFLVVGFAVEAFYSYIRNLNDDSKLLPFFELENILMTFTMLLQMYHTLMLCIIHGTICVFIRRLTTFVHYASSGLCSSTTLRNTTSLSHRTYIKICRLVSNINDEEGCISLSILLANITSVINSIYWIIFLSSSKDGITIFTVKNISIQAVRVVTKSLKLVLFIEAYHRIQNELQNVRPLLSQLINNTRGRLPHEMDSFFYQVTFDSPTYSCSGIINLSRAFYFAILSAIVSFFVTGFQLKKENL